MATAPRELTFFLAEPERRVLRAIAARLPARVTSDHLTALGILGALAAGAAYALSTRDPAWLWGGAVGLLVNWFGDSLDGTLARVRGAERPRYGYYLDHCVDACSTAAIGLGVGLSPFVTVELALGLVLAYLVLSINVYLETAVFGAFRLGYGRVGPTEARILLALVMGVSPLVPELANILCAAALVGMVGILVVRFVVNLKALAQLEPPQRWAPRPASGSASGARRSSGRGLHRLP